MMMDDEEVRNDMSNVTDRPPNCVNVGETSIFTLKYTQKVLIDPEVPTVQIVWGGLSQDEKQAVQPKRY